MTQSFLASLVTLFSKKNFSILRHIQLIIKSCSNTNHRSLGVVQVIESVTVGSRQRANRLYLGMPEMNMQFLQICSRVTHHASVNCSKIVNTVIVNVWARGHNNMHTFGVYGSAVHDPTNQPHSLGVRGQWHWVLDGWVWAIYLLTVFPLLNARAFIFVSRDAHPAFTRDWRLLGAGV